MSTQESEKTWDPRGTLALVALLLVLLTWAALGYWAAMQRNPADFGQMFGAASALFSGLAFAGLVYTILLQRSELAVQRQDLAETRRELHAQTSHFEEQNQTLRHQALVTTFFELLRLHNDIVNAIDLHWTGGDTVRGRDCFKIFVTNFKNRYAEKLEGNPGGAQHDRLVAAYDAFYESRQADVGHYFRSLYNMVKLIDRSDLPDKRLYTNIVRAQLSSYEQVLLLYNCLTPFGDQKFKPLIEQYGFFKNLNLSLLIDSQDRMFYAAKAFV